MTIEDLLADSMEYRPSFEVFKSNVCHQVHDMGDMDFIINTLETDRIRKLHQKRWYPESLYLLAMVDYISRENDLPLCNEYVDLRSARLREPIYPLGVITMSVASHSEQPKVNSFAEAIPEFKRFNIIESDVRRNLKAKTSPMLLNRQSAKSSRTAKHDNAGKISPFKQGVAK